MLVGTNIVRMVCYSLASPVLWTCSSLLSLDFPMESCMYVGYVFKCSHVLKLVGNCIVVDT